MKQLGRLSLTCGEGRAYAPVRDHAPHLSLEGAWSPGGAVLYFTSDVDAEDGLWLVSRSYFTLPSMEDNILL